MTLWYISFLRKKSLMDIQSFHIIGSKELGGAELFFARLLNAFSSRKLPVTALLPKESKIRNNLEHGVSTATVGLRGIWDLYSSLCIKRFANLKKPHIVQTYLGRATRLTSFPNKKTPIHVARLGSYYPLKHYQHAHAWVGNTKGVCDYLLQGGFPKKRVFYISNFVTRAHHFTENHLDNLKHQLGIPLDAWSLVSVGRLHPTKGFDLLLHAFSKLPSFFQGRPLFLVLVGSGPLESNLKHLAKTLKIESRVCFAGWRENPGEFYALSDLLICPSREETLGNVILEAWNYQRPVVSTKTHGALELETHKDTLYLVNHDPKSLQEGIERVLKDEALRETLIHSSHETLLKNYSETKIVEEYQYLYQTLLSNH